MAESSKELSENCSEEKLLELAKKELLRDVKCASMRAEQFGAHSWAKPQKYVPSKRFLRHMLYNVSRDNIRRQEKHENSKSSTRITSAVLYKSRKYEHQHRKDDRKTKKRSRWDSPPDEEKTSLRQSSESKEKKRHHHRVKTKDVKTK